MAALFSRLVCLTPSLLAGLCADVTSSERLTLTTLLSRTAASTLFSPTLFYFLQRGILGVSYIDEVCGFPPHVNVSSMRAGLLSQLCPQHPEQHLTHPGSMSIF